jgi:hypothetical protein
MACERVFFNKSYAENNGRYIELSSLMCGLRSCTINCPAKGLAAKRKPLLAIYGVVSVK